MCETLLEILFFVEILVKESSQNSICKANLVITIKLKISISFKRLIFLSNMNLMQVIVRFQKCTEQNFFVMI